jgi:hypothetical protein
MINNANNSINWPINRINRSYWLLLAIIAIKCNDFIIVDIDLLLLYFRVILCALMYIIVIIEIKHCNVHCCDY